MIYCDVSLPVPLDQALYLSAAGDHAASRAAGLPRFWFRLDRGNLPAWYSRFARMPPDGPVKEALRLVDEEPVLDAELLSLGRWIAQYYCAPLGEVLRSMTPLSGEVRKTKLYSLTDAGRDTARQLLLGAAEEDPTLQILQIARSPAALGVLPAKEAAERAARDSFAGEERLRRDGGSGSAARSVAGIGHPAASFLVGIPHPRV